jgi:hypothetical protein
LAATISPAIRYAIAMRVLRRSMRGFLPAGA